MSRPDRLIILAACILALGTALVAQFGFDMQPCHLCTLQRLPYVFAAFAALIATGDHRWRAVAFGLCAIVFVVGAGLAVFHIGVERHWWESACSGGEALAKSAAGLLAKLSGGKAPPACDSVAFALFGVSFAGMNLIASLILAAFAAGAARRAWRR